VHSVVGPCAKGRFIHAGPSLLDPEFFSLNLAFTLQPEKRILPDTAQLLQERTYIPVNEKRPVFVRLCVESQAVLEAVSTVSTLECWRGSKSEKRASGSALVEVLDGVWMRNGWVGWMDVVA
jgi:hypothetical protein